MKKFKEIKQKIFKNYNRNKLQIGEAQKTASRKNSKHAQVYIHGHTTPHLSISYSNWWKQQVKIVLKKVREKDTFLTQKMKILIKAEFSSEAM